MAVGLRIPEATRRRCRAAISNATAYRSGRRKNRLVDNLASDSLPTIKVCHRHSVAVSGLKSRPRSRPPFMTRAELSPGSVHVLRCPKPSWCDWRLDEAAGDLSAVIGLQAEKNFSAAEEMNLARFVAEFRRVAAYVFRRRIFTASR